MVGYKSAKRKTKKVTLSDNFLQPLNSDGINKCYES